MKWVSNPIRDQLVTPIAILLLLHKYAHLAWQVDLIGHRIQTDAFCLPAAYIAISKTRKASQRVVLFSSGPA